MLVQLWHELFNQHARCLLPQRLSRAGDCGELVVRSKPVGRGFQHAAFELFNQPGDPDHVELVEVAFENREEL